LLENAREALSHDQVVTAIEALNRLLNLPPNSQSQAAQKMIGEAREKNGEFDKARVEYEIYLKFPMQKMRRR
jgi:predicted TPR repeat methyltransferase